MIAKSFVIRRTFLVISAGIMLSASGERCLSQDAEHQGNELHQIQILLGAEGLDIVSPALKGQQSGPTEQPMLAPGTKSLSELHSSGRRNAQRSNPETKYFREQIYRQLDFLDQEGAEVRRLRELFEQLQLAQENSETRTNHEVAVAVFAVPEAAQEDSEESKHEGPPRAGISFAGPPRAGISPFRPPGFGPTHFGPPDQPRPDQPRPEGRPKPSGRVGILRDQDDRPELHFVDISPPVAAFDAEHNRIKALAESAERLSQAGLPDLAHGLRERAGQIERELAAKLERMQQEQRQRAAAEMRARQELLVRQQSQRPMDQRRTGIERGDQPAPPLHELHEQMEQLRRDMHKLSEQMAHLTRLIQQHHNPGNERGHHEDMDDDEEKDDDDDDHKERGEHEKE